MILILTYDYLVHEKGWGPVEQEWYQERLDGYMSQYANPDAEADAEP